MTVTVTNELIESGKSSAGGWSKRQLKLLGLQWPPRPGWKRVAMGRVLLEEDARLFVELRGAHTDGDPVAETAPHGNDEVREMHGAVKELCRSRGLGLGTEAYRLLATLGAWLRKPVKPEKLAEMRKRFLRLEEAAGPGASHMDSIARQS